jgi:hypothetical protein
MPETNEVPPLFSRDFHFRFFPSVLRRILLPKKQAFESPFAHHAVMEFTVVTVIAFFAAILGFAAAVNTGSIAGWFFAILGTAGLVFVTAHSLRSRGGEKPTYGNFRLGVFLFLLVLGFTAGMGMGHGWHAAYGLRLLCGIAGAGAGYFLGILGGLGVQYLGWLSGLIDLAAYLAAAGTIIVAILLLL